MVKVRPFIHKHLHELENQKEVLLPYLGIEPSEDKSLEELMWGRDGGGEKELSFQRI